MQQENVEFRLGGLDCESEAATIQRGMKDFAGILDCKVYAKSGKVRFTYDADTTSPEVLRENLGILGFPVVTGRVSEPPASLWRNPKVLTSLASGCFLVIGYLISWQQGSNAFVSLCYLASLLSGAYYFGKESLLHLFFEKKVGIELLMLVAAVVAGSLGQLAESAMLAFLYSMSEAAEGYTEEKTRSAVKSLMDLTPKKALVRLEERESEIPVEELQVGQIFIVKPGQSIPTDGEVISGISTVNQAPVTGESTPVKKEPGETVFAGTINGEGSLDVRATKGYADNTIARIIHLVEEAQEQKGLSQRFIERFGARYSPAILLLGILLALVPPLVFKGAWLFWLSRATVFLVAAAPCALAISIPITLVATLGTGARQGVLIKGGLYVEKLAQIQVVAFDKTGTVTSGRPQVTDSHAERRELPQLLAVAAAIERRSQHPLATAVVAYAEAQNVPLAEVQEFQSLTGAGASATWEGAKVYVGSPQLFSSQLGVSLEPLQEKIYAWQMEGKTVVVVGDETAAWGILAIRDQIRGNAKAALKGLRLQGIQKIVMLSGDNERTALAIARELGFDEVYADLRPEDKVTRVKELTRRYGQVAMVGDGVNDAPALAQASVGIAMGAAGTDVALETADVALMGDDLEKLVYALQLARRSQKTVRQNLALSVLVIGVLVVGATGGFFNLPTAVLGHELSEFLVIASGLRMLKT
jgi:heavy metal translocating P-type ATPase